MLDSYIEVGTEVEAMRNGAWELATIDRIDREDDVLPYGVRFTSNAEFDWKSRVQVRVPDAPAPTLQYRLRSGTRWSEWAPLTLGQTLAFSYGNNAFQVRVKPTRTDADILAKLREYTAQHHNVDARFAAILGGNY
jgi:hypothetical protein